MIVFLNLHWHQANAKQTHMMSIIDLSNRQSDSTYTYFLYKCTVLYFKPRVLLLFLYEQINFESLCAW